MSTVGDLLASASERVPGRTCLVCGEESFTFDEVDRRANGAAAALHALGIRRGDRVAALLGNDAPFLFAWFGLARAGAALLPMNPASRATEVSPLVHRGDPALLLFDGASEGLAAEVSAATGVAVASVDDVTADESDDSPEVSVEPDDVAVLLPTSGTTGASKLVMQTHRAFVLAGEGFPWWLGLEERDRLLTALPLFHLNALAYSTLGALTTGASLVVLPRFSASRFLDEARACEATQFNVVGAMLEILMRQPARPDDASTSLRLCYTALAPASEERHLAIERRFGMEVIAGYGLSETPYGTIWPRSGTRRYGSMGHLKQHPTLGEINEARVVDDDGREVVAGETGELLLRNPAMASGYFGMPEETARLLRAGWLYTGDLVRVDSDGTFYFVARKKDIVRRRGENIAPAEIEDVLVGHPAIVEAAVVGVPSDLGEEDIKAFVVVRGGLRPAEAGKWVRERLSRHKVPRYVEIVEELPRTPTGRVAKHLLPRERTSRETMIE